MNPVLTNTLAVSAFLISLAALLFTFRKDAHRIHLDTTLLEYDVIALGINNDSAYDSDILAVGHFDSSAEVTWINKVGEYQTGKWITYPITVKGRSKFVISLVLGRDIPYENNSFGYCVLLATGRLYVLSGTAPLGVKFIMHFASFVSRISGGRYITSGIDRVRLPTKLI